MKMLMKIHLYLLLIVFQLTSFSQVVYEPLHRDIYEYLSRLSQKGLIEFDDQIKPLSRTYFAEKLKEINDNQHSLTRLEKDELNFYLMDFERELKFINKVKSFDEELTIVNKDNAGRMRLFSYSDELFTLNVSPIIGVKIGSRDDARLTHFWNGIYTYGYITDNIGISFDFRDNTELGTTIDKFKKFTPVTGTNERSNANIPNYSLDKVEYSEVKTVITGNWQWGSIAVGKEFFEWGYGENAKLVLSQKAPSFPFIRLDIRTVEWFSFNYIHAWLASDIVDSTDIYYTTLGDARVHFRDKYLASHTLVIKPVKGLSIALGESIVYSDKIEISYLIPFMFFRLADHYLSRHNNSAGGNAQIFGSVSSRNHIPNTHFYGTLFIDEITINGLFDSGKRRNQFGFSVGASVADIPFDNLSFALEYTRVNPFTYKHYIPTTTYNSSSHTLGHWMGHNSDQIYCSVQYRILRGLKAKLWGQYIRKGEEGEPIQQHIQPQPPFLFGLRKNYIYYGGSIQYEFFHELFAKLDFQSTRSSVQQENQSFIDKTLNEFYFSVFYGL